MSSRTVPVSGGLLIYVVAFNGAGRLVKQSKVREVLMRGSGDCSSALESSSSSTPDKHNEGTVNTSRAYSSSRALSRNSATTR